MNRGYSLDMKNGVIPAKAGIQRIKKSPAHAERHHGPVRFAGCFFMLDSGLRRNDGQVV
jgi:hypothetical protein